MVQSDHPHGTNVLHLMWDLMEEAQQRYPYYTLGWGDFVETPERLDCCIRIFDPCLESSSTLHFVAYLKNI